MMKLGSIISLIGILLIFLTVSIFTSTAQEPRDLSNYQNDGSADIITIDDMEVSGPLERPVVIFRHDLHTDALEKLNKDCSTCHLIEKEDPSIPKPSRLSLKFKRHEDTGRQESMDIYHNECMTCHKEISARGEKAGPIEVCGRCHQEEQQIELVRQPMGMDKSLHFRHTERIKDIETGEGDCKLCHHEYNEDTKKLFYAKGEEGSCRYCHKIETEDNRIAMRFASHLACIDCHRKRLDQTNEDPSDKEIMAGPIKCSGCHDPEEQQKIKRIEDVPRLKRDQPDTVLIQADTQQNKNFESTIRMNPVPFDHLAHEQYNETCIACHHSSMDSCTKTCHILQGSKDGEYIQLEQAMHQISADMSCIGCHEINKKDNNCAGCHAPMGKARNQEEAFCIVCHMPPLQDLQEADLKPEEIAGLSLQTRNFVRHTYTKEEIPETKIIGELSEQYSSVEFPHLKILQKLVDNIIDNKLAGYFHSEKESICQACHHNSPASMKPPSCTNCHSKPFDEMNSLRPGLKAAYHQLCIGCHKEMSIEKPSPTGCTDCHKEIGLPSL